VSSEELSLLLGGIDLTRTRRKDWYRKEAEPSEKNMKKTLLQARCFLISSSLLVAWCAFNSCDFK
jgi:hypothetical protein